MITIRPADAMIRQLNGHGSRYIDPAEWFVVYEHFARQFIAWEPGKCKFELLNNTSSIHNIELDALSSRDAARRHLVGLFREAGRKSTAGDFLRFCGINTWADLDRPMQVRGWKPHLFADRRWFNVMGRQFESPGPNRYHRRARCVYYGALVFCVHRKRWRYRLEYGYPRPDDYSRWYIGLHQNPKESREHFAGRVNEWLAAKLIAEGSGCYVAIDRERREREWLSAQQACKTLFNTDKYDAEGKLATATVAIRRPGLGDHRIPLTKARLRTLLRWAKEASSKSRRRDR